MIVTLELEDEDYPSLREVVWNATDYEYTDDELLRIWDNLPEDIQLDAAKWGMSDTEVREKIYEHITEVLKN